MATAFVLAAASAASAQSARVDRIDIVDKGIYTISLGEQTTGANTPSGTITAVPIAKNIQATTTIQGRLGVEFGLHYMIVGAPTGAEVTVDIVNTYPKPGLVEHADAKPILESRFSRAKNIGEPIYLGYGFENAWEIVPGTWTFEIWYQGRKLAEQSFTVTK
jgi:hypothetical protein